MKKDKNGSKSLYKHNDLLHLLKDSIVMHFMEHAPHKLSKTLGFISHHEHHPHHTPSSSVQLHMNPIQSTGVKMTSKFIKNAFLFAYHLCKNEWTVVGYLEKKSTALRVFWGIIYAGGAIVFTCTCAHSPATLP